MRQKFFHSLDALAGGASVSALPAVVAALAGKAIIRAERDNTAAENVDGVITRSLFGGRRDARATLQHRPADGTVADIEGELQIRIGSGEFFFNCIHDSELLLSACLNWNQDKVR